MHVSYLDVPEHWEFSLYIFIHVPYVGNACQLSQKSAARQCIKEKYSKAHHVFLDYLGLNSR